MNNDTTKQTISNQPAHTSIHAKKNIGDTIAELSLIDIQNRVVQLPVQGRLTHLQFRRFAGCPVCNLHLQSFVNRHEEINNHGIQEVIVFHATTEKMTEYVVENPFYLIADAEKRLYQAFGVTVSWKALLKASVMGSAIKGMRLKSFTLPERLSSEFITPADFLIDETGKIIALNYGKHADDQWSVDELLALTTVC